MSTPPAAAVLFDLDGLLVDSEPVWYDVESAAVARLGGRWTPADQAACIGGTIDRTCDYMVRRTGAEVSAADLRDQLLRDMVARFRAGLPLRPGAGALLAGLRERTVPLGLVSSSYRVLVDAALGGIGAGVFTVSVAGDEITHGKPHPEPYLRACAALDAAPPRIVVLEDAIAGVISAEAAGCPVVAVPSVAPIPAAPTRVVVDSLAQIDAEWLLGLPRVMQPACP